MILTQSLYVLTVLAAASIAGAANHWTVEAAQRAGLFSILDSSDESQFDNENVTRTRLGPSSIAEDTSESAAAGLYFQAWDLESCGGNSIQVTFESAGCADFSGTSWNDITSCWFISNGLTCTLYENGGCIGDSTGSVTGVLISCDPAGCLDNALSSVFCSPN